MEYCGPKEGTKEWFEDYYGIPEKPKEQKPKVSKWVVGAGHAAAFILGALVAIHSFKYGK